LKTAVADNQVKTSEMKLGPKLLSFLQQVCLGMLEHDGGNNLKIWLTCFHKYRQIIRTSSPSFQNKHRCSLDAMQEHVRELRNAITLFHDNLFAANFTHAVQSVLLKLDEEQEEKVTPDEEAKEVVRYEKMFGKVDTSQVKCKLWLLEGYGADGVMPVVDKVLPVADGFM